MSDTQSTVKSDKLVVDLSHKVVAYWAKASIFEESVSSRTGGYEYIFYDGPPFANGLPHYGHILTGFIKDIFARYHTMLGEKVDRKFGWDCHGLPAEMGSEKELGISGKIAITQYGIDNFNNHCKTSVLQYTREWHEYVYLQARWVDFVNGYKTMDISYMESTIWSFKRLYDMGLVYEDKKVMPYSWKCETPLSNFETRLDNSYREKVSKAVTVKFELNPIPEFILNVMPNISKAFILSWTTTPWTLPSNLAIAVNPNIKYRVFECDNIAYICSNDTADRYIAYFGAN